MAAARKRRFAVQRVCLTLCPSVCLYVPGGLAAVAEVGDPPGAPGVSVLSRLGDGSGWLGFVPHAGHQPL